MSKLLTVLLATGLSAVMAVVGGIAGEIVNRIARPQVRAETLERIHSLGIIRVVREALSSTAPQHHQKAA